MYFIAENIGVRMGTKQQRKKVIGMTGLPWQLNALLVALRARLRSPDAARSANARAAGGRPRRTAANAPAPARATSLHWSLDTLHLLDSDGVESLCARYYEAAGFRTETVARGNGGIDVKLTKSDPSKPLAFVRCRAQDMGAVGIKDVRALLTVMARHKVERGIYVTSGSYSAEALAFGADRPLQLLDGPAFSDKLLALPQEQQAALLASAFGDAESLPNCPTCGMLLLARSGKRGAFWSCGNYPGCTTMIPVGPAKQPSP